MGSKCSNAEKLAAYGLYKQATVGDVNTGDWLVFFLGAGLIFFSHPSFALQSVLACLTSLASPSGMHGRAGKVCMGFGGCHSGLASFSTHDLCSLLQVSPKMTPWLNTLRRLTSRRRRISAKSCNLLLVVALYTPPGTITLQGFSIIPVIVGD